MVEGHIHTARKPHEHSEQCTHSESHYTPRVFSAGFALDPQLLTLNARAIRKELGMLVDTMATHKDFKEIAENRSSYPQFSKRDTWFLGVGGLLFPLHILYRHSDLGLTHYHWPGKPHEGITVIPLLKE